MNGKENLSIVIPAKNEADNLRSLLPKLIKLYPKAEVIVVDDGSEDGTVDVCQEVGVVVLSHPESKGNGASIKTGARFVTGEIIVFMDGDGQHHPEDVGKLLEVFQNNDVDMVVGARSRVSQASIGRLFANTLYNKLASWMSSSQVEDLTSGFRAVKRVKFSKFIYLLPNGFSYPTTITMAFFRAGYSVKYVGIEAKKREGKSHIRLWKDGVRFLLIIFKVGTLYSPLKIFFPIACIFFITGVGYYLYTYITSNSFTNMGAVLFISSVIVFLIGLVSEQITALMYKDSE